MANAFESFIPFNYRPRLIIWNVSPKIDVVSEKNEIPLTTQECFAVMDNISEFSKPIMVLSTNSCEKLNNDTFDRADIVDLILYGNSLGLKMIVETCGQKLNQELRNVLRSIGTKSIRILIHDRVKESIENGFLKNKEFSELDQKLNELRADGFEIQLGITLDKFDERTVAFMIDYAVIKNARGIYFHLSEDKSKLEKNKSKSNKAANKNVCREDIIAWIAKQKRLLPEEMYFSPQCIRYGFRHEEDILDFTQDHRAQINHTNTDHKPQIGHWCLGGKTFAYITNAGKVQICHDLKTECGDLRKNNYNFKKIWERSDVFKEIRNANFSCLQTRNFIGKFYTDKQLNIPSIVNRYNEITEEPNWNLMLEEEINEKQREAQKK
jgi:AdoMet-dependent heme synthase